MPERLNMFRSLPLRTVVITAGLALTLAVIVAFFFGTRYARPAADPPALLREIRQLNELATVQYTIQKVVGIKEKKIPLGSESLLLVVQGKVTAGIDLSRLTPEQVRVASNGPILIDLPPPQIQRVYLDEKDTQVWDRRVTWWTPWVPFNPDLERQARLQALESIRATALEQGILDDANRNAERAISGLLKALGFDLVVFSAPT
jgi:hypothetical protein